ncbi:MAG: 3-deoxy-manno-octulosonate cytidylyltransferase [Candidatus Marinimicrobia bacterium]|jgi:3-deoxy-manno-octulosonate cytidylyltransferase (CMP-KDO synthetase)|nr:3-deoxy-manno-octulosonate cytidylyltransferase [Candidatus Neomarinimicrobiota bacterium]
MNIGVVPARLASTRLPRKILADLNGKPMIAHVMERSMQAKNLEKVILAIDSEETLDALGQFDFEMVMTSPDHISGTDRIAEVVKEIPEAEIIINIQGDEPLIEPDVIDSLVDSFEDDEVNISTVVSSKLTVSDLLNPNVVKAIVDENKDAIEFKRNIFDLEIGGVYRHIGLYGFRRDSLFHFTSLGPSVRETDSKLEQLRALDHGISIRAAVTRYDSFSVDTQSDLDKVTRIMETTGVALDEDIENEKN